MNYALDTDSFTLAHFKQATITSRIDAVRAPDRVDVTIVTRIEALRGRFDSITKATDAKSLARMRELLRSTEHSLGRFDELDFDDEAFRIVDLALKDKRLKKVGRCDLLIACICLAHGATLVTRNVKDFKLVPGLKVVNWAD